MLGQDLVDTLEECRVRAGFPLQLFHDFLMDIDKLAAMVDLRCFILYQELLRQH